MEDHFVLGDHKACCDVCGFNFKGSQLRKRWDNMMVCSKDWEPRNPLDNARPILERNNVRDARPEPADRFLTDNEITPESL